MSSSIEFSTDLDGSGVSSGAAKMRANVLRELTAIEHGARETNEGFEKLMRGGQFLGAAFGGEMLIEKGKQLLEFGSRIKDMSESVNMGAEDFQRFSFAIEQSGGSAESFQKGINLLNSKMQEALSGNKETLATFERLGVTWEDLQQGSPANVFLKISDALHEADGSGRMAADAMGIFGKQALRLIPGMKEGSAEILKLGSNAAIARKETIDAAEKMGDKMDELGRRFQVGALEHWFAGIDKAQKVVDDFDAAPHKMGLWEMYGGDSFVTGLKGAAALMEGLFGGPDEVEPQITAGREQLGPKASTDFPIATRGLESLGPTPQEIDKMKALRDMADQKTADDAAVEAQRNALQNLIQERREGEEYYELRAKTADLYKEMGRDQMSSSELINDLESERAEMLKTCLSFENDIFGVSDLQAAKLREQIALLDQRIQREKKAAEIEPKPTETGEQFGPTPEEVQRGIMHKKWGKLADFDSFNDPGLKMPKELGALGTNSRFEGDRDRLGLERGLHTNGGLNRGPYGYARHSAAAQAAQKAQQGGTIADTNKLIQDQTNLLKRTFE